MLTWHSLIENASPFRAATVTVERGLWGSSARSHAANTSVLAPIYHSKGGWPGGSSGHIRYALDPGRPWVAEYNAVAYTSPDVLDGAHNKCIQDAHFDGY